jgi:hypothetical protein
LKTLINLPDKWVYLPKEYGKLEYRLSYNKPFATNLVPTNVTTADNAVAVDNSGNTKWSKAGYFEYQFLDQEANVLL